MKRKKIPRPEYPRPDFVRNDWLNLNGWWNFEFDDENRGLELEWFQNPRFSKKILVPFPFQSEKSGIADQSFHDVFWYHREIAIPEQWKDSSRVLLHFGAFDYQGTLWINGNKIGDHRGGYTPFTLDITDAITHGKGDLVIRGKDTQGKSQPRGKQYWEPDSADIFYSRTSGIWQTVWMEPVPDPYIASLRIVPRLHPALVSVSVKIKGRGNADRLVVTILDEKGEVAVKETAPSGNKATLDIEIPSARTWSPEDPFLYQISLKLHEGENLKDDVQSYTGIREVRRRGRQILLNGSPIRFRGVLDQGFFPGGIYTPESDDVIRRDVELIRQLGFNGARKHQKVEDPRWYYWCDRIGILVWGEMPSSWEFTKEACGALVLEWPEVIRRDWNHPCIIAWVPINESWGLPELVENTEQQAFLEQMACLTREIDPTRLVVDNSGWCHIDTDIIDLHCYTGDPGEMKALLEELIRTGRADKHFEPPVWVGCGKDRGQPIVISEYGGIALEPDVDPVEKEGGAWGYGRAASSPEDLARRFTSLTRAILDNPDVAGYVYTQLTDVEQEKNGLLSFDRQPKIPLLEP